MRLSIIYSKGTTPQMAARIQCKEGRAAMPRIWLPFLHLGNATHSSDITAAPRVLLEMVSDPQTDAAIEKFTQDWQKVNKQ
jgi:hypothetical protein